MIKKNYNGLNIKITTFNQVVSKIKEYICSYEKTNKYKVVKL